MSDNVVHPGQFSKLGNRENLNVGFNTQIQDGRLLWFGQLNQKVALFLCT